MIPTADFSWLQGISLWQVAVTIIAVWIIIRLLVRFWPWLRKVMELTAALSQLPGFIARTDRTLTDQTATLAAQDRKIEEIHHEVNYNNGSSVKDAVGRVEIGVKSLHDRVSDLEQPKAQVRKPRAPKPKENP